MNTYYPTKLAISRSLSENMLVFILQYMGLSLATLCVQPNPIWFATGTAAAFMYMRGNSILPGIFVGSVVAYYLAGTKLMVATNAACIHTLQAYLLLWISYRNNNPFPVFYRLAPFIKFTVYTALLTAVTSVMLVATCYPSLAQPVLPWILWLQWWLANLNGILIVTLAIVTWDYYFPQLGKLKQPSIIFKQFNWCSAISLAFLLGILASVFTSCTGYALVYLQLMLLTVSVTGIIFGFI
jgi:hypothetical protein